MNKLPIVQLRFTPWRPVRYSTFTEL